MGWIFGLRKKSECSEETKRAVRLFCDSHMDVICLVFDAQMTAAKNGKRLKEDAVLNLIPPEDRKDMTFSVAEMLQYM